MATKIVTKNSSTASAVPTASDLVQGELAVNVADKRLFTEDNGGSIVELGTNPSTLTVTGEITANGGIALGDSDKATFGAGDDLQIYHDGGNSIIRDVGTGDLRVQGANLQLLSSNGKKYLYGVEDAYTKIYYDNAQKLATTSTGIDVTGTSTMDGLSVQQPSGANILLESTTTGATTGDIFGEIEFKTNDSSSAGVKGKIDSYSEGGVGNGALRLFTGNTTGLYQRLNIASNGDISFYEDTGTTAKLFWDASAESLGIGGAATDGTFQVKGTGVNTGITNVLIDASFSDASNGTGLTIGHRTDETTAVIAPRTATGNLAFYNYNGGWSESMRIDSSGNVGIGTGSTSGLKTVIKGETGYPATSGTTQTGVLRLAGGTGLYNVLDMGVNESTDTAWIQATRANSLGTYDKLLLNPYGGNVGIGTSSPSSALHVSASAEVVTRLSRSAGSNSLVLFQDPTTTTAPYIGSYGNAMAFGRYGGGESMRIDSSGNVGIGCTPDAWSGYSVLQIGTAGCLAASEDTTFVGANAYSSASGWKYVTTDEASLYQQHSGKHIWYGAASGSADSAVSWQERMRIDSSGNVGIGTTPATGVRLDIRNNSTTNIADLRNANSSGFGLYVAAGDTSSQYAFRAADYQNNALFSVMSDGNLLVGKTTTAIDPEGAIIKQAGDYYSTITSSNNTYHVYDTTNNAYTFYVNANGGISNYSGNNVNLSDEREKKNIELLESQWDSLKQWSLKKFHYNADDDSDNKKLGVIAQEVEAHNPEVIGEFQVDDETTRMAVKEQQMVWMAIKALQEAQTRIETLEARVTKLENN